MKEMFREGRVIKPIISWFMAMLIILTMMSPLYAGATDGSQMGDSSTGTEESETEESEGTEIERTESLEIFTEEELIDFAEKVNGGNRMEDTIVTLKNDIKLTEEWTPIGAELATPFSGEFDGRNHTVSGVTVPADKNGGLFAYLKGADIHSLTLMDVSAPNSTSGFFYQSVDSTVEDCNFSAGIAQTPEPIAFSSRMSSRTPPVGWTTYVATSGWVPANGISSPEDMLALAELVNNTTTLNIDHSTPGLPFGTVVELHENLDMSGYDWEPIGYYDGTALGLTTGGPIIGQDFPGFFIGDWPTFSASFDGKGKTISGLESTRGGLFGLVFNGYVKDLTITDADISDSADNTGAAAVLTNFGVGLDISNVNIINSKVEVGFDATLSYFSFAAGLVATTKYYDAIPQACSINNCAVINSSFESEFMAAPIATITVLSEIRNNVTYGCTLSESPGKYNDMSGLVAQAADGMQNNVSMISGNVVMANTFEATDGLARALAGGYSDAAILDNFMTDFRVDTSVTPDVGFFITDIGSAEPSTASNQLTDSSLNMDFASGQATINFNYWDNLAPRSTYDGVNNNQAYSSKFLTSGWTPSENWIANAGHYPQITLTMNSSNSYVSQVSDAAVIALASVDPDESYTAGVKELILMKQTPSGESIDWIYSDQGGQIKTRAGETSDYDIMYSDSDSLVKFDVTARVYTSNYIGTNDSAGEYYEKLFPDVVLYDSILVENPPLNLPVPGDTNVYITEDIKLVFIDSVKENPEPDEPVRLYVLNNAGKYVLEQTIVCENDNPAGPFTISTDKKEVTFNFVLRYGTSYKIVFPKGAVVEDGLQINGTDKNNPSIERTVTFDTASASAPYIKVPQSVQWITTKNVALSDVLELFEVYERENGPVIYNTANPTNLSPVSSAWDASNPLGAMDAELLTMAPNTARYFIEASNDLISSSPKPDTYRVYIMAKNNVNFTAKKMFVITVSSLPDWSEKPVGFVHMEWTNEERLIIDAARQGATAYIDMGTRKVPVAVRVAFDQSKLDRILEMESGPALLEAEVYALDGAGRHALSEPVILYLDRALKWTMAPSPVTMNFTTEKRIEEAMDITSFTFKNTILEYEHWSNDYRKPGRYYVDVTSEEQDVTLCQDLKCKSLGHHPSNKVNDTFIVDIIYPPGAEIENYWGKVSKELEDGDYSKEYVTLTPSTFNLPIYTIQSLEKQQFGRAIFSYDDEYRWKVYSNALNASLKQTPEYYSLQVFQEDDNKVDKLMGDTSYIPLQFEHAGKLFGATSFEYNLANQTEFPTENLALYRYNSEEDSLDMVSEIIINDDTWASAELFEIVPTTYVIKQSVAGDTIAEPINDFDNFIKLHYLSQREEDTGYRSAWLDEYTTRKFDEKITLPQLNALSEAKSHRSALIAGVSVAVVLVIAGIGIVIYYTKKKKEAK